VLQNRMKPILALFLSTFATVALNAQLKSTNEEVEHGTKTTFFRNGTKILTDEVIFVGENTPKRRIQTQVLWLGDVAVMRIDTFMIDPMRYYYFKDGIEMTEVMDSNEIHVTRKLWPDEKDIHEAFLVGDDGMLTPVTDEVWEETCVPITGTLKQGESFYLTK
ncbi:hypothetical protein, partial [Pelagicoccus sp. SDUM812002]|uniref:hypothetical protein n=1 Tax=Pelagicoccus sp. SDUM812002 TaxID=3041266 RepID=UPI00280DAC6A